MIYVRVGQDRHNFMLDDEVVYLRRNESTITRVTHSGLKRVNMKSKYGHGRRVKLWTGVFHYDLHVDFDRLSMDFDQWVWIW